MKADSKMVTSNLKTARGQLEGVLKMVEEDRYCVDISHQLLATIAILKKVNKSVLHAHLTSCVRESFEKDTGIDEKMNEILSIVDKLSS